MGALCTRRFVNIIFSLLKHNIQDWTTKEALFPGIIEIDTSYFESSGRLPSKRGSGASGKTIVSESLTRRQGIPNAQQRPYRILLEVK